MTLNSFKFKKMQQEKLVKIDVFDTSKSLSENDVEVLQNTFKSSRASTIGHESSSTGKNPLHCPLCRKTFSSQQTYKNHESSSKHRSALKNNQGLSSSVVTKKNSAIEPQWLLDVRDDLSLIDTLDLSNCDELMEAIDIYWESCQILWHEGHLNHSFECLQSLSHLISTNEVSWQNELEAQVALARLLGFKDPQESLKQFVKIFKKVELHATDGEQELVLKLDRLNLSNTESPRSLIQVLSKDIFVALQLSKAMSEEQFQSLSNIWLYSCKDSPSDIVIVIQALHRVVTGKQKSRWLRDIALTTSKSSMVTQSSYNKERLQLQALALRIDLDLGNLEIFE